MSVAHLSPLRVDITTKNKYYKREAVCAGMIEDVDGDEVLSSTEPCIGTSSSGDAIPSTVKVVYTAGIEFVQFRVTHAIFNPWEKERHKQ